MTFQFCKRFWCIRCDPYIILTDEPRISFQRTENPDDYQCFTAIIKSTPEAYYAQWKIKGNDADTFTPIDVNSGEYKGTSSSLPCPVLIVNRKELFDKYCFQIEVNNFVGCCIKDLVISGEREFDMLTSLVLLKIVFFTINFSL